MQCNHSEHISMVLSVFMLAFANYFKYISRNELTLSSVSGGCTLKHSKLSKSSYIFDLILSQTISSLVGVPVFYSDTIGQNICRLAFKYCWSTVIYHKWIFNFTTPGSWWRKTKPKLEHNLLQILGIKKIYYTVMAPGFHCEVVL